MKSTTASKGLSPGSVLMECVIVLPLYFALFGGLFFLGEIAVNRLRMKVGDFGVTWMGGDRHGVSVATDDPFGMEYLFQERFDAKGKYSVWEAQNDDDQSPDTNEINYYMALYQGCVDFSVGIPDWIRGLLFAQSAMTAHGDELSGSSGSGTMNDWDEVRSVDIFKESLKPYPRSVSVHRVRPDTLVDQEMANKIKNNGNRARMGGDKEMGWSAKRAQVMLADGTFLNVLSDKWISQVNDNSGINMSAVSQVDAADVPRALAEFGE